MKRADIEQLLPEIFRRTLPDEAGTANVLQSYLDVMALLLSPSEAMIESVDGVFDPFHTPDRFVPYLAGWLDLDPVWIDDSTEFSAETVPTFPTGVERLRALVATAAELSRWRGTMFGMLLFLETATGVPGFAVDEQVTDEDGKFVPFHIRVGIPKAATDFQTLIRRIVEIEKPAYVTYELALES